MKYFILVALLLCGCSHTTVHLYSRYLSKAQIATIDKALKDANFVVEANNLAFPKSVTQSSVIYSPVLNNPNAVNKVVNELADLGWDIHYSNMLFIDNHWYRENSIALLLVPLGVDPQKQNNPDVWAKKYHSQNCEFELSINLSKNGEYKIESTTNTAFEHDYTSGQWNIDVYPYLELRSPNSKWRVVFSLSNFVHTDLIGEVNISQLTPMENYALFAGCTFEYGVRK
ncbi:MAG: hypothetical protein ABJK37_09715 [Paraglaciecola sp.]|uniref:hypothetical protein n=1 Tax=Paraglaciecola sp. TaxID=1920173 RepID=UPI003299A388